MRRTLLAIIMSALAAGGMSLAHHDEHGKGGAQVKLLSQKDIIEKLDGKKAKATMVEVTLAPGEVEAAHRHPGPAFGYILEGEYEWAIDDQPAKKLKVGDPEDPATDVGPMISAAAADHCQGVFVRGGIFVAISICVAAMTMPSIFFFARAAFSGSRSRAR